MRRLAVAAVAAAFLLPAGPAVASVGPGDGPPPTVVTPAAPILAPHVWCQYEVRGRVVSVGLPLGVKGAGERTVVEVTRPYSAQAKPMPAAGYVRFRFPLRLTYKDIKAVTWAGHKCGVA